MAYSQDLRGKGQQHPAAKGTGSPWWERETDPFLSTVPTLTGPACVTRPQPAHSLQGSTRQPFKELEAAPHLLGGCDWLLLSLHGPRHPEGHLLTLSMGPSTPGEV